jgi:hypothetical protein
MKPEDGGDGLGVWRGWFASAIATLILAAILTILIVAWR